MVTLGIESNFKETVKCSSHSGCGLRALCSRSIIVTLTVTPTVAVEPVCC